MNTEAGFYELLPPVIVKPEALLGTGQLPKFEEDLFKLTGEDQYYLIPTAEVPLSNLAQDEILEDAEMPTQLVAHSTCFRSEAYL